MGPAHGSYLAFIFNDIDAELAGACVCQRARVSSFLMHVVYIMYIYKYIYVLYI